ncbi:hypothetical protein LCGC14_2866680 [marine sediment metagenome]|uniref:YqaJ viral recombinase domain-containing protein n=1 Tax=marine sediment metagenome TaxID=412755 RepID=A0A0F9ACB2_9ZZZZ
MSSQNIEIFDCEQNSPEWDELRRGCITASQFSAVMSKGRGSAPSKTRRKYMLRLAADRLGATPADNFSNSHMERGHLLEEEARNLYAFVKDVEPVLVGFVKNGEIGASPDAFLDSNGLLEIKTRLPELQLECLEADKVPAENITQCMGQLWVTQREYLDYVSFWPGLPIFIKRLERDEAKIAEIKISVEEFSDELNELVKRFRSM